MTNFANEQKTKIYCHEAKFKGHSKAILNYQGPIAKWFSYEQIKAMAQAVKGHRTSSDHEPRGIYVTVSTQSMTASPILIQNNAPAPNARRLNTFE